MRTVFWKSVAGATLALLLAACGSEQPAPPTEAPTADSASETDSNGASSEGDTLSAPGYSVTFTVTGDFSAEVEAGSYAISDYAPVGREDLSAFNVALTNAGGINFPVVGIQAIQRSVSPGDVVPLGTEITASQSRAYLQQTISAADGYAISTSGSVEITAYDGETVSGTVTAVLTPGAADGTLTEGATEAYTVSGTFADIPVPAEDAE